MCYKEAMPKPFVIRCVLDEQRKAQNRKAVYRVSIPAELSETGKRQNRYFTTQREGNAFAADNNDIAPFKNILNEMYSKDISKKVHSSYLLKAQKGQFTGCLAPFGYRKDPEDKNHLLIDCSQLLHFTRTTCHSVSHRLQCR